MIGAVLGLGLVGGGIWWARRGVHANDAPDARVASPAESAVGSVGAAFGGAPSAAVPAPRAAAIEEDPDFDGDPSHRDGGSGLNRWVGAVLVGQSPEGKTKDARVWVEDE